MDWATHGLGKWDAEGYEMQLLPTHGVRCVEAITWVPAPGNSWPTQQLSTRETQKGAKGGTDVREVLETMAPLPGPERTTSAETTMATAHLQSR